MLRGVRAVPCVQAGEEGVVRGRVATSSDDVVVHDAPGLAHGGDVDRPLLRGGGLGEGQVPVGQAVLHGAEVREHLGVGRVPEASSPGEEQHRLGSHGPHPLVQRHRRVPTLDPGRGCLEEARDLGLVLEDDVAPVDVPRGHPLRHLPVGTIDVCQVLGEAIPAGRAPLDPHVEARALQHGLDHSGEVVACGVRVAEEEQLLVLCGGGAGSEEQ